MILPRATRLFLAHSNLLHVHVAEFSCGYSILYHIYYPIHVVTILYDIRLYYGGLRPPKKFGRPFVRGGGFGFPAHPWFHQGFGNWSSGLGIFRDLGVGTGKMAGRTDRTSRKRLIMRQAAAEMDFPCQGWISVQDGVTRRIRYSERQQADQKAKGCSAYCALG